MTYTWVRMGRRKRVPYENPEGRRVNALAGLLRMAGEAELRWTTKPKAFVAEVRQGVLDLHHIEQSPAQCVRLARGEEHAERRWSPTTAPHRR